jgi:hypothetical protein
MFKIHYGTCQLCGKDEQLIVVKRGLCQRCNHEEKQAKKKAEGKKSGGYKYVRTATGEKDVFQEILDSYDDKPIYCFVCKKRLTLITHHCFAHVLSKGRYPKFRLNPDNIKILCFDVNTGGCHRKYDFSPKSDLENDPNFADILELREKLIKEYNNQ